MGIWVRLDCGFVWQNMQYDARSYILRRVCLFTSVETMLSFKIASASEATVTETPSCRYLDGQTPA